MSPTPRNNPLLYMDPDGQTNPQAFLSFARDFVVTAVTQGSYAAGDYISKGGSTIYRAGNDFLTGARDGRILSYVQGANAGGVAAKYTQLGGK